MNVARDLTGGAPALEFAYGYAFGMVTCLLLGAWLYLSDGHDLLGRRLDGD